MILWLKCKRFLKSEIFKKSQQVRYKPGPLGLIFFATTFWNIALSTYAYIFIYFHIFSYIFPNVFFHFVTVQPRIKNDWTLDLKSNFQICTSLQPDGQTFNISNFDCVI